MVAALVDQAPEPLEDRIASVVGLLNAASAELVALVAEALDTGAWEQHGIRSPAHWVALQCGTTAARAAGLVDMARGLADLPMCRALFEQGALSEDQARVIARGVDAAHDDQMADLATHATVGQLAHAVSKLPKPAPEPEPEPSPETGPGPEPEASAPKREVAFGYRDDGHWWCRIVLPGDEGAVVQAAIEQARNAELRLCRGKGGETDGNDEADGAALATKPHVTWADAIQRLVEAALTNLDPSNGRPGDRYQVYLHVNADAPLSSYLHLGPGVSDGVRRFLTCDAPVRFVFEEEGRIVALSEKQDTVDTKTRKLVEDRDGGCRVPGCGQIRWLHIHHIRHREEGGPTRLDNLCCLCPFHHRLHHAGLLDVSGDPTRPDGLVFVTPGGRRLGPAPPRPPGAPVRWAARERGIDPDPYRHPTGERADWRWFWWR